MTFDDIARQIPTLSVEERKQLIALIVDSLTEADMNQTEFKERIPGLNAGSTTWISDDFDEPLPDELMNG